jgi:uncharacterized Zn finger protein
MPPPLPQLPNIECPNCAEGNTFMEHVETRTRRLPSTGPEQDEEHFAIFRCVKCHHVHTEAFDPNAL